jgi:hypothetical protein
MCAAIVVFCKGILDARASKIPIIRMAADAPGLVPAHGPGLMCAIVVFCKGNGPVVVAESQLRVACKFSSNKTKA